MKRSIIGLAAMAVAIVLQAQPEPPSSSDAHMGTWRLASFKYGTDQPGFADYPQDRRRLKLITATHFTWVDFGTATKRITGTAGGTYTLSGNSKGHVPWYCFATDGLWASRRFRCRPAGALGVYEIVDGYRDAGPTGLDTTGARLVSDPRRLEGRCLEVLVRRAQRPSLRVR